ncbi:hypothetical protein HNR65_001797 [Desulfosalsimonas propionicica]|uniref:Uncharacterized protein n=1 Tax=Desulfosalsimonas propionicica TaxID=332175 RepID=A0A7W0C9B3_9BACT|nr:hypothetical protein [Desulfosalsimonas propionicica]MBA2881470.1 hypothetical protein [Desulfosalsimonas propionicica]
MEFVFIIGVARTGSKIYKNSINSYTDIDILNEMHYLSPRWLRKDFCMSVSKTIGKPLRGEHLEALINLMFQKQFNGTFWQMSLDEIEGNENSIQELDRDVLASRLGETNFAFKTILETLLCMHAEIKKKRRGGQNFQSTLHALRNSINGFLTHAIFILREIPEPFMHL